MLASTNRLNFCIKGLALCGCLMSGVGAAAPIAGAQALYYDRSGFLADNNVTTTSAINFDDLAVGTDLTDKTINGVTFGAPSTSPLQVIDASAGVRFPMSASTGANVLSPGGSDPTLEDDDLSLIFDTPVQAAGLDVVFDSPDGASFVGVTFYDVDGAVIASDNFIPSPIGAPGYQFVGLVSTLPNIKRVVFDESDNSPDDDNVAYDSVVYSPAAAATPAPGAVATMLVGAVPGATLLLRRRRR